MSDELVALRTTCAQNGLDLSEQQLGMLEKFSLLLLEWNKSINLVSRRDTEKFFTSHLLHSLAILLKLDIPENTKLLDLGTGGGLPGIPIKIARPDLSVTLLDSTQKKINVVQSIIKELQLERAEAVWGRAEELGTNRRFSKQYDSVVVRAVAPLKDLVKWSVPFLNEKERRHQSTDKGVEGKKIRVENRSLITLKGGDLEGEIRQLDSDPRVKSVRVVELTLAGSTQLAEGEKKIVVVDLHVTKKAS